MLKSESDSRRRRRRTHVEAAHGMKNKGRKGTGRLWSGGAGRNRRGEKEMELSATLLPVLVKCCVLSERQPRMCQPSHLTLPNGLLNADIKLTRSFALPFSSLSLYTSLSLPLLSPCPSPCRSLVLFLSFTCFPLPYLSTTRSPPFPFFPSSRETFSCLFQLLTPDAICCRLFFVLHLFLCRSGNTLSLFSTSPSSTGSIMLSTLRNHPSSSPCCTSCRRRSTA